MQASTKISFKPKGTHIAEQNMEPFELVIEDAYIGSDDLEDFDERDANDMTLEGEFEHESEGDEIIKVPRRAYSAQEKSQKIRDVMRNVSGAARKRYQAMVADNISWERALEMCQKKWNQLPAGTNPKKRLRLERIQAIKTTVNPDEIYELEQKSSYEVNSYFTKSRKYGRVRIKSADDMNERQSELLRRDLIDKVAKMKKGEAPRFDDYIYTSGTLTISCRDKQSQLWLLHRVPAIEPWPGAKLTASIVPVTGKRTEVNTIVPRSETTDMGFAFSLLKVQNRGLNTEEWNLLSTSDLKAGTLMTISIDQRSADALKESSYNACLGFKTIRFSRGRPEKRHSAYEPSRSKHRK